ncbi:MAG: hypothetical protein LBT47_12095 [Deltaproteobacteria bacterium]|jgi:hypothetical protein|nr:hypothetical protein [Deltaproteobacteria bacterium]
MKNIVLALDTGGTNTDAVIFDTFSQTVLASAKAFTTHDNLAAGIVEALECLSEKIDLQALSGDLKSINLSTTLATNAIAEGQGHLVGLIMIGFDPTQAIVQTLLDMLPAVIPIFVSGGHDYYGRQEEPLNEDDLIGQLEAVGNSVSAWAVSSFFSIKNPAHELKAAEIIQSRYSQPVTMGRSLSGELGAMRRAATAALNAGLVIIIDRLLEAVSEGLKKLGLTAPVMVVKGDGGLVGESWARQRPIETVVSGPAAGLVGAKILAQGFLEPDQRNLWVLDVGGTTSDLAYLKDGWPDINPNGAKVGQWHTMVEAVEVSTRGLGGDSLVEALPTGELIIGPRRVLPLGRLAERYPEIVALMSRHDLADRRDYNDGFLTFFIPNLPPGPQMGDDETEILNILHSHVPLPMADYQKHCLDQGRLFAGLKSLSHPAILVSGFTPTDAMNVLGLFSAGQRTASKIAAQRLGAKLKLSAEQFCRLVLNRVGLILAEEILTLSLAKDGIKTEAADFKPDRLLGRILNQTSGPTINFDFRLAHPVILLGAPAAVLAPFVEKYSCARVLAPPCCQVASAVGAAGSSISLSRKVDVVTLPDFTGYRAFLPDGLLDDTKMETVINRATHYMNDYMASLAKLAGSQGDCQISCTRVDHEARLRDGARLIMGASLTFTAFDPTGPALAQN